MEENKRTKHSQWYKVALLVVVVIGFMLLLEFGIQTIGNKRTAENTSEMLLNQVIGVLKRNDYEETELLVSLKEDYIVRAKAVAYMVDQNGTSGDYDKNGTYVSAGDSVADQMRPEPGRTLRKSSSIFLRSQS